jgi:uncharacterized membrane protein
LEHPLLSADFRVFAEQEIAQFEQQTSCEVRIHLETQNDADLLDRAAFVFDHLGMRKTQQRNAILIYIQLQPSQAAIIGDIGLSFITTAEWSHLVDVLTHPFKGGQFKEGVHACLIALLEKVQPKFPYQSDDINELTNQISR